MSTATPAPTGPDAGSSHVAPSSVAFFGPAGTWTHMAARSVFGAGPTYIEAQTIPAVFEAVASKRAACGVVPIENSTDGSVSPTLDGLLEHGLLIRAEVVLEITQCLIGQHTDLERFERVSSHPQGLAQCRHWLRANLPNAEPVVAASTSAAAWDAKSDAKIAAIASRLAAELTGLLVIREGIQDRAENATRFVVIADADAPRTGRDKTSLVFSTEHRKGALREALDVFDSAGLNLTRIESRPALGRRWEYVFFTDLEGHRSDAAVAHALQTLKERCSMVQVLGSYPRSL